MQIRCPRCSALHALHASVPEGIAFLRCATCRALFRPAAELPRASAAVPRREGAGHPPAASADLHTMALSAVAEALAGPEIVAQAQFDRTEPRPRAAPPRRTRERRRRRRPSLALVTLLCIGALPLAGMAAVAQKERVVRAVPASAALFSALGLPVNLRGLAIGDLHGIVLGGPASVLALEGTVRNLRPGETRVPVLRIAVRDGHRREIYHWTIVAPKAQLAAGETLAFRARLAAPPAAGQDIIVGFADP